MTREATSQGRRGGIFLAMFAVVALRSTTVLATMESVEHFYTAIGTTEVYGGDILLKCYHGSLTTFTDKLPYSDSNDPGEPYSDFAVTCCDNEVDNTGSRPGCLSAKTHQQAVDHCASNGKVLCSADQISNGAGSSTGCGFDWHRNWLRDPCVCVSYAPSHWNVVAGTEFRVSTATTPDYIHFTPGGCNSLTNDGYVEGNVPTTPGVTYVVKVELGVVTIPGASNSRSLKTTVGQASQTFNASALVPRSDRSLYEWVEAATFTAAANSLSTTLRFEEGDYNCMDMKDVELCPVCDASAPIANGDVGNCTSVLIYGESCTPTCDTGYLLMGERSCVEGTYR